MLSWDSVFTWGRRASDRLVAPPAPPVRDKVLEGAISQEQIDVLFQPVLEPRSGAMHGAEALARWPVVASADALFARAVQSRLDERLSRLVQRKALRAAADWHGALSNAGISINLLPADIASEGFDDWLLEEIAVAGIAPQRVTVEITESALLVGQDAVAERLGELRAAGVKIAVDDFGTGYASLAYLTDLPLDYLKIDRGLVANIVHRDRDRIVVRALVRLAHELGLKVVVEGVESTAQLRLLADWDCDLYQGFIGAGALTGDELQRFADAARIEAA